MQSLIILGKIDKTRERLNEILNENKISKFDTEVFSSEKTIGINDVKLLQKNLFLKPVYSPKKAVVLEATLGATTEAQNALLKVLEEPPESAIMVILTQSLDYILPTILSRCNLIDTRKKDESGEKEISLSLDLLNELLKNSGNPLLVAQTYGKNKEEALNLLSNLIMATENELTDNPKLGKVLKKLQKTYTIIKTTNVNVRFALENLFLNL